MKKSGLITWGALVCVGLLWATPGILQFALRLPVWIYLAAVAFVANVVLGYVLMKKRSQGMLVEYLYTVENITAVNIAYLFNIGLVVLFSSNERLQLRPRFVLWPLGVIPSWFAVIFIVFQFAFIGLVWWLFLR